MACPILLANCFKEILVQFRPIGGLPSAPPMFNESTLSGSASQLSSDISGNGSMSAILVTSVFRSSTGCWNLFVGRLTGGVLGAPAGGSNGELGLEDVGRLSRWFSSGHGCTLGAPADNSPCPGICRGGEHLSPSINTLADIISYPLWLISWISLGCTGGWLRNLCYGEWRLLIKLRSAWKWVLWRRVTIAMQPMILIGLFPKSTVFARGNLWTIFQWFWIDITVLLTPN